MKNIFIIFFIFLFSNLCLSQEKEYNEKDVPRPIVTSFYAKYPDAKTIGWSAEDDNFEVNFKLNDVKYEANFSSKGDWIETAMKIKKNKVPDSVMASFKSGDYGKWKIITTQQVETPDYKILYMIEFSKKKSSKELYYTPDGKFLKEE